MTRPDLGVLVIATGRYLDFARDLVADLDRHVVPTGGPIVVNLLTDRTEDAAGLAHSAQGVEINPLPVPALRWPEASLLRYEMLTRLWPDVHGDALVYLDADLRVHADFSDIVASAQGNPDGLLAVAHPGYYERGRGGPRGTWETRRRSAAYVPRRRRRTYVCGGVWMGSRSGIQALSQTLASRVATDTRKGLTAVWHDESHWNWWVAHHETTVLSPAYCHVPEYPWLSGISPVITAVDKGGDFVRDATSDSALDDWQRG